MRYVDVILPLPLDGTFTYSVPEGMEEKVVAGMRVLEKKMGRKYSNGIV